MPPDSPISDTGFVTFQTAHRWPGNVLIAFNTVLVASEAALASCNTVPVAGHTAQGWPEAVPVTFNVVPVVAEDVLVTCYTVLVACPTLPCGIGKCFCVIPYCASGIQYHSGPTGLNQSKWLLRHRFGSSPFHPWRFTSSLKNKYSFVSS